MASETQPSDPSRTVLFNKYEMGRLLGKGTFAKVYFAKNIQTSESVAIKVIHKDHVLKNHFMMDQIKREISVMRLVRHPNVVHLREVLATRSKIFFVMDLVRGGELFSRVARSKLREDLARRYFQQLISAVHFCHARGVSHRDLKPENLLLDDNGGLKVSDFGLSALPEQLRYDGLLHTQCGTPAYVAPEVLRKRGYDGSKADIWSCGVVLFVLLAGFLPFQDENLMRMYRKVFKADFHFPPWISPDARRLISRLLVVDPAKRISIPEIMAVPWFKKGYVNPLHGSAAGIEEMMVEEEEELKSPSKPAFFNAFELISSMSSGFDLSGLFETEVEGAEVFTSRAAAGEIMERLMGLREGGVRRVWRVREFKVRVEGERLAVTAEVFEAAPEMAVVEISRSYGDAVDYRRFCEEVVRPALKDIVWSWRGGTNGEGDGNRNGNGGSGSSLGVF